MPRFKNLLCPLDLSPASLRAFDYGIKLAKNYDARLQLLHVISPVIPTAYDFYIDTDKLLSSIKKQADTEMKRLRKVAADAGVQAKAEVRTGEVESEIVEAVKNLKIDIVIMGKHGRRGIERWFVGSVTDRLADLNQVFDLFDEKSIALIADIESTDVVHRPMNECF